MDEGRKNTKGRIDLKEIGTPVRPAKEMTDEELNIEEYCESCRDDSYGIRLRELREELNKRRSK